MKAGFIQAGFIQGGFIQGGLMKTLLAVVAGVLNALSFAPFDWWPLCLLSIAILFSLWLSSSRSAATWYGFVFGLGMFGLGISWMYVSIHTFGGMPAVIAGLCVLLLVMIMSLFPAVTGLVQGYFSSRSMSARTILIMPATWLMFEWLRGWIFTGLPWLTTGYAMLDTPLAGLAPVGGVYLVSILTLITAGVVVALIINLSLGNLLLSLLLALGWITGWQISGARWTQPEGEKISVAIIQNNVPLMLKWDSSRSNQIVADYLEQSARHQDVDLVVWPEAAVPDYLDRIPEEVWRIIREHPADFIFGVLYRKKFDGEWKYFNSIAAVNHQVTLYNKQHLVPFGEYFPLKWLIQPVVDMLDIPMSDFSRWQQPQGTLHVAGNSFAASICYEDAFPEVWRSQVAASGILINVSEDMWFGDSLAPHQRLQMARFRSLESGRPMIRSSNNGLSSVISWKGEVTAIAPQFVKTVVTARVQPRTGMTPYMLYGNYPALILAVVLLLLGLFGRRREP